METNESLREGLGISLQVESVSARERRKIAYYAHTRQVTELLLVWGTGDEASLNNVILLMHDERRRIAGCRVSGSVPDTACHDSRRGRGAR